MVSIFGTSLSGGSSVDLSGYAKLTHLSGYVPLSGNNSTPMTGLLNMGGNEITGLSPPTQANNAVTRRYADDIYDRSIHLDGVTDPIISDISMSNHTWTNVKNPVNNGDTANKGYVDKNVATKLNLDGTSSMSGTLNMGSNKIENVADPLNPQDAINLRYLRSLLPITITGVYVNSPHTVFEFPPRKNIQNGKVIILGLYIQVNSSWCNVNAQTYIKMTFNEVGVYLGRPSQTITNTGPSPSSFSNTISPNAVKSINYICQYLIL